MLGMVMRVVLDLVKVLAMVMMVLVMVMVVGEGHALETQERQISNQN